MTGQKTRFSKSLAWVAAVILAPLLVGCATNPPATSEEQAEIEVEVLAPMPEPEPAMHVTRDAHISLFGEIPGRDRIPFQARPASPMKQHSFTTEGADFDVDVSPDGTMVVFSSTRHSFRPDLYLKGTDGRAVTQVTSDPSADVQPCLSPDGRWIAFASLRSGNWDIWLISINGGQPIQITRSPIHEVHPSFAPDGQRLAYCAFNEVAEQWELRMVYLDQPGSTRVIGQGLFPEWSPVADSIIYQRARQRGGRWFSIWRLDLTGGEPGFPTELAASSEMALIQPSWSPDGQWVTYGTAEVAGLSDRPSDNHPFATRGDIWIIRADGTMPLQLTDGAGGHFGSVWGTDGRIYFTSVQNDCENLWSIKPLQPLVTQLPVGANDSAAIAPPAGSTALHMEASRDR